MSIRKKKINSNKLLPYGITLLLLTLFTRPCRVSNDFKFPTIEESYFLCGAVLVGRVENNPTPEVLSNSVIFLKDVEYYKGCGPSEVKITGYSSGSRCGISPPRTGKKIIVFVCRDPDVPDGWVLHRYAPFSGQFRANKRHMRKLNEVSGGVLTCEFGGLASHKCSNRRSRK